MELRRADSVFIVQKYRADMLAKGFVTLPNSDYYEVVHYVRSHFQKIGETRFFDLYR
jgi:hypothetical protein